MINTYIGQMKYTRNTFFKVSKPFRWYGPVHEFIVCDEQNITSGLAENIHVDVKMTGNSWLGDIAEKYAYFIPLSLGMMQRLSKTTKKRMRND